MNKRALTALAIAGAILATRATRTAARAAQINRLEAELVQLAWDQEGIYLDNYDRDRLRRRGLFTTLTVDTSGQGTALAVLSFQRDADGNTRLTIERTA